MQVQMNGPVITSSDDGMTMEFLVTIKVTDEKSISILTVTIAILLMRNATEDDP